MAAIEMPTGPARERRLRSAELTDGSVDPTPEEVRQFGCPLDDCEKQSDSMYGIRQHISIVHDPELNYATMECQQCGDQFDVTRSKISSSAFCSRDCKFEFGVGGGVSGSPTVLDPPIPVEISTETRYPCPVEDCDVLASSPFGLRKHATQMHEGLGRVTLPCELCGQKFHVKAAEAGRARFCSKQCLARGVTPPTRYRLSELDPEDVGLPPIGERRDPFDTTPVRAPRPIPTRPSWGGKRPVNGGSIHDQNSPWGRIAAAIVRLYLNGRTIVCTRHIAAEADNMTYQFAGWYLRNVPEPDGFWRGIYDTYGIEIEAAGVDSASGRTYYLRPTDDTATLTPTGVPDWIIETGEEGSDDGAPEGVSEVSFALCNEWRRAVSRGTPPEELGEDADHSVDSITAHVEGHCTHGFQNEVAPVRYNGVEWKSTAVGSGSRSLRRPSRRGATFDG